MSNKRTVSFSLKSEELKQTIDEYAKMKGFRGIADLSRVALLQYINRHKPKNPGSVLQSVLE